MKKLFLQTYGCQMASLLHAGGEVYAELKWFRAGSRLEVV